MSALPTGMTCSDCVHTRRCVDLGQTRYKMTKCSFDPSRWEAKPIPACSTCGEPVERWSFKRCRACIKKGPAS